MEENYNSDPGASKEPKTSSTDSKQNPKTTGDSQVQDGEGVERPEAQEKSYEKSDEQQEYIQDANNNTAAGNESPVKDGKGLTM
jgi:molybdopterin converting factor small subunit